MMLYEITYLSKDYIASGRCLDCPLHFINLEPAPGIPATGCELTGEFLPDEWDIDNIPWDKCPVIQCEEQPTPGLDKFGKLMRDIRITRSLLLYDMAKKLNISSAELSAIECGKNLFQIGLFRLWKSLIALVTPALICYLYLRKIEVSNDLASKDKKNSEGYSDPTAYAAMRNISREEDRYRKLRKVILNICDVAGFEIRGPIVLMDKKSGKVWR